MKALSINQPWAWLIVNGYKNVENRNWPTNYRGPVLIHAGKKYDDDGDEWIRSAFPQIPLPNKSAIERGGIVGRAVITDCVTAMDSDWFFGKFGFVLNKAEPCEMVPCLGELGFFRPDLFSKYKEMK